MLTAELEQRWRSLFPGRDAAALAKEWECIESRYSEPHRHYHTLEHIAACLRWLDQVRDQVEDARALELALWFHDFVYNPRRQDNEDISTEYAVTTLSLLQEPRALRDRVKALILVTRHPARPQTPDQAWMIDIDLAILGAEAAVYDTYAAQVRQEYQHIADPVYRMGRTAVLQSFLAEPALYHTDFFRQRLQEQARANLSRELAQ